MAAPPTYVAFFGVMGATSAMVFSGKIFMFLVKYYSVFPVSHVTISTNKIT